MITNEIKAAKKLDDFLSIFPINTTNVNITHSEIIGGLLKANGIEIEQIEAEEIIRKLQKDGYIREVPIGSEKHISGFKFYITFEGRLFRENGGYEAKYWNENAAMNHAELVEKAMLANNKWMKVGTLLAAGATSLYLLWTVFVYGLDHHWWFCHHCH